MRWAVAVAVLGLGIALRASGVELLVNPPTDIALSASSMAENNAANAIVGTLSAIDPDAGATHAFTLVSGTGDTDNAAFNVDGNALRLTVGADFETKGSYSVRIRATDNGSLTFEKTFVITVTDVNEAPTITAIADQATLEDTSTGAIAFTVGDAETAVGLLTVTATSSDLGVVAAGGIALGGSGTDRTITLTPVADAMGASTIKVTVADGSGGTTTLSFEVMVTAVGELLVNGQFALLDSNAPSSLWLGSPLRAGWPSPAIFRVRLTILLRL